MDTLIQDMREAAKTLFESAGGEFSVSIQVEVSYAKHHTLDPRYTARVNLPEFSSVYGFGDSLPAAVADCAEKAKGSINYRKIRLESLRKEAEALGMEVTKKEVK